MLHAIADCCWVWKGTGRTFFRKKLQPDKTTMLIYVFLCAVCLSISFHYAHPDWISRSTTSKERNGKRKGKMKKRKEIEKKGKRKGGRKEGRKEEGKGNEVTSKYFWLRYCTQ